MAVKKTKTTTKKEVKTESKVEKEFIKEVKPTKVTLDDTLNVDDVAKMVSNFLRFIPDLKEEYAIKCYYNDVRNRNTYIIGLYEKAEYPNWELVGNIALVDLANIEATRMNLKMGYALLQQIDCLKEQ